MALDDAEKAALTKIEASMARKGFDLGDILNKQLGFPPDGFDAGDGQTLDTTQPFIFLDSAGVETRVLDAPAAGFQGIIVIAFGSDGGNITINASNVLGFTVEDFTFTDEGDTIVLMASRAGKWIQLGGNKTPA